MQPAPLVWFNGEIIPLESAKISILDRGFLFGDGVYEAIGCRQNQLIDFEAHLQRLFNSLEQMSIVLNYSSDKLYQELGDLLQQCNQSDAILYLQVTRGTEKCRTLLPQTQTTPTVCAFVYPRPVIDDDTWERGITAITLDDFRWQRCDIKCTSLAANVIARLKADEAKAQEAIFIRNNYLSEGASSNVFVVIDNTIYTPPKGGDILPGITRDHLVKVARDCQMPVREESLSLDQLIDADEIALSSSAFDLIPVTTLNHKKVGKGAGAPVFRTLYQHYLEAIDRHE